MIRSIEICIKCKIVNSGKYQQKQNKIVDIKFHICLKTGKFHHNSISRSRENMYIISNRINAFFSKKMKTIQDIEIIKVLQTICI